MGSRWVVVLLAVCDCNQVFGLEDTTSIPLLDTDGDGVPDDTDNCPTVPNADQAAVRDTDAFGDACDLCPEIATTYNHDEDGDHVGDECDVCPGDAGYQTDPHGDGVGDACRPRALNLHATRQLFDAFEILDPRWRPDSVPWANTIDAVAPTGPLPPSDRGLALEGMTLTTPAWRVAAHFSSLRPWADGERFGFGLLDASGDLVATGLVICGANQQCMARATVGGTTGPTYTVLIEQNVELTLDLDPTGSFGPVLELDTAQIPAANLGPVTPVLFATPNIQVSSVDVITAN